MFGVLNLWYSFDIPDWRLKSIDLNRDRVCRFFDATIVGSARCTLWIISYWSSIRLCSRILGETRPKKFQHMNPWSVRVSVSRFGKPILVCSSKHVWNKNWNKYIFYKHNFIAFKQKRTMCSAHKHFSSERLFALAILAVQHLHGIHELHIFPLLRTHLIEYKSSYCINKSFHSQNTFEYRTRSSYVAHKPSVRTRPTYRSSPFAARSV